MPYYDSPPQWLLGLVVAAIMALIIFGSRAYTWLTTPQAPRRTEERVNTSRKTVRYKGRYAGSTSSKPLNPVNPSSALPDAGSASGERSAVQPKSSDDADGIAPAGVLPANAEELTQLARAITLLAQGSTQKAAIETAFSCTKGGGDAWKRGKALVDAATSKAENAPPA